MNNSEFLFLVDPRQRTVRKVIENNIPFRFIDSYDDLVIFGGDSARTVAYRITDFSRHVYSFQTYRDAVL